MTPRTSLLEHSLPSTIKEVPAELHSNCARAGILQIEPASAISSPLVLYSATQCIYRVLYPVVRALYISREEYFTEFTVPFSSREGKPTTSNLVLRAFRELP